MGFGNSTVRKSHACELLIIAVLLVLCSLAWIPKAYADAESDLFVGSTMPSLADGLDRGEIVVHEEIGYETKLIHVFNGWSGATEAYKGVAYDRVNNTLTLSNVNLPSGDLNLKNLGQSFKINVVGTNRLRSISSYSGSISFTGNGTLVLNESKEFGCAIYLNGNYEKAFISAEASVSLKVYARDEADYGDEEEYDDDEDEYSDILDGCICICKTTAMADEALVFLGSVSGYRVHSTEYADKYMDVSFYPISFVEYGNDSGCQIYKRTEFSYEGDEIVVYYAVDRRDYVQEIMKLTYEDDGVWYARFFDYCFEDNFAETGLELVGSDELVEKGLDISSVMHSEWDWVTGGGNLATNGFHTGWFYAENNAGELFAVHRNAAEGDSQWECYALTNEQYEPNEGTGNEDLFSYIREDNPVFVNDLDGSPEGLIINSLYPVYYTHAISTKAFEQLGEEDSGAPPAPAVKPTPTSVPTPTAVPATAVTGLEVGNASTVGGVTYLVTDNTKNTIRFERAPKSKKSVVIPASVKINGKTYAVVGIAKNAFKGCKAKTVTVKSKKLTKKTVKGCFKGAKNLKTVKVKVGNKKTNKKYIKKYKKIFTKKNCGKKVTVK